MSVASLQRRLAVLCAIALFSSARGALIATSKLEQCLNEGTEQMRCSRKMVVTLTVDTGEEDTESILTELVLDAVDEQGQVQQLEEPFQISLAKYPVRVYYPLFYFQVRGAFLRCCWRLRVSQFPAVFQQQARRAGDLHRQLLARHVRGWGARVTAKLRLGA
jgi:hypothetical protein